MPSQAYPLNGLHAWRMHRGFDVDTLASRAGVSSPTLRRVELGAKPAIRTWRRLADALDLGDQPHELLHDPRPAFSITELADCVRCQADVDAV